MSKDRKRATNLREGYNSDTSYDPSGEQRVEPHETRHKVKLHASALHSSEPKSDTMAMIRLLMEEQRRAESEREEAMWVADMERDEARRQEEIRREHTEGERGD